MKMKKIAITLFITLGVLTMLNGCNNFNNNTIATNSEEKVDSSDNTVTNENCNNTEEKNKNDSTEVSNVTEKKEISNDSTSKSNGYEITNKTYSQNNVKINYPQIENFTDPEKLTSINKDLEDEALSILNDYLEDDPNLTEVTMDIKYEVKLKNEKYLSIVYIGESNVKGAAHPLSVFYTTNIDIKKGNSIRLSDYANINDVLTKLKDSKNIKALSDNQELAKIQKDTLLNIDNDTLLNMLKDADFHKVNGKVESPKEGVYSYIDENGVVISIQVNHAIGDHAEFKLNTNIK